MGLRFAVVMVSIVTAGLLVATMAGAPSTFFPADTESEPSTEMKLVRGKVWMDSAPVVGAYVNVSMYDGAVLRSYYEDFSDSQGDYLATFGGMGGLPWAVDDVIVVFAESGDCSSSNNSVATTEFQQYVNVTIGTVIPEFGDLGALMPVLAALGMFMAFFYARKGKGR